jgi:uncharacterized repeat protein (TIGR01451 family)
LPATDQRGDARIVGNAVDIGAYEFGATAATTDLLLGGNALSSAAPGGQITYTLTVTNNSAGAQSNVTLTDLLPANTTLVSWTTAPGWSSSATPAGSSGNTVSAWIASLAPNSSTTFTLVVQVATGTTVGTVINNTASVAPFIDASNPSQNSASFNTTVLSAPIIHVVNGGPYNGNPFPATATAVGTDGSTPVAGSFSYTYYTGSSASGTPLTAVPVNAGTYTVAATFTSSDPNYSNGSAQTTFTIAQATTGLGNLTARQLLVGTNTTTVSGRLTSNTSALPVGQSVAITLNGVTQHATVAADGSFAVGFATGSLGVGTYALSYSYGGDNNFTAVSGSGSLSVAYGTKLLFPNTQPVHAGLPLPIILELTNVSEKDVSAANITVTATSLVGPNGVTLTPKSFLNANSNGVFLFVPIVNNYLFTLDTSKLASGTYTLYYTAGKDPTQHSLTFLVH